MSKERVQERYDYDGGYVEVVFLPDSNTYEVWEHISDAYGYDQFLRKRTRVYPDAIAVAVDIARSHDDLTGGA